MNEEDKANSRRRLSPHHFRKLLDEHGRDPLLRTATRRVYFDTKRLHEWLSSFDVVPTNNNRRQK